ncbi:TPA: Spy/CpxP family protein refolding chaperone [Neisseria lactamica]
MPLLVPSRFAKPAASLLGVALLSCQLSCAAEAYIPPNDFQANCDIRRLGLTQGQHNELRKIRAAFKMAGDRARLKVMHSEHSRRRSVVEIISSDVFNRNEARDYVESRYLSGMDFAVDELEIQHRFFHILTPQQQQMWLSSCLK